MTQIDAIETEALGLRFRSRLEARWALFFYAGGIRFEYEPEGIKDGDIMYLPDFYLPDFDMYVEVKPERPGFREELKKPLQCVQDNKIQRLMILQNIPQKTDCECWWYPFVYYNNGKQCANIARCLIAPRNDKLYVLTWIYVGYVKEYWNDMISDWFMEHYDFNPKHDDQMPYEDEFRWSGTLEREEEKLLHKAYGFARMARFEHERTL